MIVLGLTGGLGNQLFQYALGRALAIKNGDVLKLDVRRYTQKTPSSFHADTPRDFGLAHFSIVADIATEKEAEALKNPYGIASKICQKLYRKLTGDHKTGFDARTFKKKGDMYLEGFWQSERYFSDIRDTLLTEIRLKNPVANTVPSLIQDMESTESICMQVRRGDYIANPVYNRYWGTCSKNYYRNALAHIQNIIGASSRVFVFTDDVSWVEENLDLPKDAVLVSRDYTLTDYEELEAMRHGRHFIISNSTFGWWGAWLGTHPKKIVVAPFPWTEQHQKRHRDIVPTTWTQLAKQ